MLIFWIQESFIKCSLFSKETDESDKIASWGILKIVAAQFCLISERKPHRWNSFRLNYSDWRFNFRFRQNLNSRFYVTKITFPICLIDNGIVLSSFITSLLSSMLVSLFSHCMQLFFTKMCNYSVS